MTDQDIERELQAKGKTAPRLTPDNIEAVCGEAQFHVFPGTSLTVCCLHLRNGFTVVGESASASLENFDREIGEKLALKDAKQKVWRLEGYLLRERLIELKG